MEKEFVSYEIALALKELKFDEECLAYYKGGLTNELIIEDTFGNITGRYKYRVTAPLYQQAFKFFREKYNIDSAVIKDDISQYFGEIRKNTYPVSYHSYTTITNAFESYAETEKELLNKLIELCTKN